MKALGLIGKSLEHSFSKTYFADKFKKEGIEDYGYELYELSTIDELPDLIQKNKLVGLNVTIPYKESVIPFLDELSPEAIAIGAVNTIKIIWDEDEYKTIGYNTDAFGFHQSIKPYFKGTHEKALILGTGGASKAVAYVLRNLGVQVNFISRSANATNTFNYGDMNDFMIKNHLMIVNTTPVGTYPDMNHKIEIPYQFITPNHLLVDLIYNPEETQFLKEGRLAGARTVNGLPMLHQQAERAWTIFRE